MTIDTKRRELLQLFASSTSILIANSFSGPSAWSSAGNIAEFANALTDVKVIKHSSKEASALSTSYNQSLQQTPQQRLLFSSSKSIAELILQMANNKYGFAIRSGGHCFADFSQHPETVLDVRELKHIEIDVDAGTVILGAGVTLYEAYFALAKQNLTLAGGTHPNVGIAGHVLGGGIGYFTRQAGLLCDQLISVTYVTADGKVVEASAEQNQDLFWASKGGGGGSFGLAIEFKFKAIRTNIQHSIYIVDTVEPDRMAAILNIWQNWSHFAPLHTTTHLDFTLYPNGKFLVILSGISAEPNRAILMEQLQYVLQSRSAVHPNYIKTGTMEAMIRPLFKLTEYISESFLARSDYIENELSNASIHDIVNTFLRHPPGSIKIVLEPLRGLVTNLTNDESAYPHRDASFLVQYLAEFFDPKDEAKNAAAIADIARAFAPEVTGGAYVNYPDPTLQNWQQAYWGENLDRLKEIKRKYDPDNVFKHKQSVPVV